MKFTNRSLNKLYVRDISVNIIIRILRFLLLAGLCYVFLFPVFYMFTAAFQSQSSIEDPTVVYIPKQLSLSALKTTWDLIDFSKSAPLTAIIAAFSTVGTLFSCSLAGYALARFRFAEKKIIMAVVVLMIILPPQTTLLSSYLNFRFFDFGGLFKVLGLGSINLLNTPHTFILPSFFCQGLRSGLFIFIFRQFFLGMPKDLEEAAKIDGCGTFSTFVRIIVPLAGSAFITVLLFSFIWHWNDYYNSSIYFIGGTQPLSVMLERLRSVLAEQQIFTVGQSEYQIRSYMQVGCLLTITPPLIIYIFTQRFFTESIERTGIVG